MNKQETAQQLRKVANFLKGLQQAADDIEAIGSMEGATAEAVKARDLAVKERDQALAAELAAGPTFAHGMTKTMLQQEWAMTIEQAVEAEAQAQAICMQTQDFRRAYEAFAARQKVTTHGI